MLKKITVKIARFDSSKQSSSYMEEFTIAVKDNQTVLQGLENIKESLDSSLTFRSACKSGICGSCAIKVNNKETLACKCKIKQNDEISALNNSALVKDLVISLDHKEKLLAKSEAFLKEYKKEKITNKDVALIDTQSNCILCQICYSSCPVYEVNKDFLGPYALSRVYRYISDKKENDEASKLLSIQKNGIWDCTLCGNCTMVCPQFIDSKTDILKLRSIASQNGYEDPNIQDFNSFDNSFSTGFDASSGFNPNF